MIHNQNILPLLLKKLESKHQEPGVLAHSRERDPGRQGAPLETKGRHGIKADGATHESPKMQNRMRFGGKKTIKLATGPSFLVWKLLKPHICQDSETQCTTGNTEHSQGSATKVCGHLGPWVFNHIYFQCPVSISGPDLHTSSQHRLTVSQTLYKVHRHLFGNTQSVYYVPSPVLGEYLAWRIPWMEEPGRIQSVGSQRVGQDWATNTHTHTLFEMLIP